MRFRPFLLFCTTLLISLKSASQLHFKGSKDSLPPNMSIKVLPQNFYTQTMGFACKKEWALQKAITIPLFIRLGTKEYVDRLERKPNSFVGRKD